MSLPPEVAAALYGVSRILTASIKQGLIDKMTVRQVAVLLSVAQPKRDKFGSLVNDLAIPIGTFNRIVDSLVDLRLVEKSTSPMDARKVLVEFTPMGEALMTQMAATNYRFRKGDAS